MALSTIMVHVDFTPTSPARLKLAADLAERFQARLIGITAREPYIPIPSESGYVDERLLEEAEERASGTVNDAERLFRDTVGSTIDTEWRCSLEEPTSYLLENACCADLIVVGRQGRDDQRDWRLSIAIGDLLMGAGRPLLVVPPSPPVARRRILVAWANRREARRAIADALPFLKQAEDVLLVHVDKHLEAGAVEDAVRWLERHGITAHSEVIATGEDPADEILELTARTGSDLIVSGGYGHSRIREWAFGGMTRTLLAETPVPCLLSH